MHLPPGYTIHIGFPSVAAYCALRTTCGLFAINEDQARLAHIGSWHGVYITYKEPAHPPLPTPPLSAATAQGTIVAMGRIVGDGGWYFNIADIAVHPVHQKRGLGGAVMQALLSEIKHRAPPEAVVMLVANKYGAPLYRKKGFLDVAEAWGGVGMGMRMM
ncbi:putative GNAT family N-acetyltransferase [Cylindrobasidium torrendii FP15055 ss-10]|uniref:Putative GNAT family N-acetyltransferase n=1 Tax=Cylindrobasidium torrendii FP15055 ss-10 TaxID=1314674 RepID=A0A0D7BHF2_9AGAR|nr:putative GNAT family N-acetyltransferase [Cylindrobasidium torrendii FP15055 ss-10]